MRQLKHIPRTTIRLISILGFVLPVSLASCISGTVGADVVEVVLLFCLIFLLTFLSYWIVAKVVVQQMEG